jgi:hypothetical protein
MPCGLVTTSLVRFASSLASCVQRQSQARASFVLPLASSISVTILSPLIDFVYLLEPHAVSLFSYHPHDSSRDIPCPKSDPSPVPR